MSRDAKGRPTGREANLIDVTGFTPVTAFAPAFLDIRTGDVVERANS
jgi:hypothetical protein